MQARYLPLVCLGVLALAHCGSNPEIANTDAGQDGGSSSGGNAGRGGSNQGPDIAVGGATGEGGACGSNFKVTLKDFNKPKSKCESTCGDGIVASDELCDDGATGNDGAYGHCGIDCKSRGPSCGDGKVQKTEGEACDDGLNLSTYGTGCAPGCVTPPFCGDGEVQSTFEQCDDADNSGEYGKCAAQCVLGPRCGDDKVERDAGEQCDDGNRQNRDGCNVSCKRESGVF